MTPPRMITRTGSFYVVRTRRWGLSWRLDVRCVAVSIVLFAALLVTFVWSISVGPFAIGFGDVVSTLLGDGAQQHDVVINKLRLPRSLTAVLVGAAFAMSGSVFQRAVRNPLASPDIIGVNAGATAAAVFVIIVLERSGTIVTIGALVGAFASALAIYALSYKNGIAGFRLVLVGIGVTAMATSFTSWLLTRAELYQAQRAMVWLTGSLNNRTWDHVWPAAISLAVVAPVLLALARSQRMLELGDDTALALGTAVTARRSGLLAGAVILAAVGTASAGPVAFVALIAPNISRRLVGPGAIGLVPAALVGSLMLLLADLIARQVLPVELPVGVVTGVIGAPYLLALLVRANRAGLGG